jgi:glutamate dehydrogenase
VSKKKPVGTASEHPQSVGRESDPLLSIDELAKSPDELEIYIRDITETVRSSLDQSIAMLTPWFFKNMPQIYYQTVPRADKVRHLSTIITGHVFETRQTVELWNRDRTEVTFIGPGGDMKLLTDLAKKLELVKAKTGALYYSHDKLLFIANFFISPFMRADVSNKYMASKINRAKKLLLKTYPEKEQEVDKYIKNLDHHFVKYGTARRLRNTFRMYTNMIQKEAAQTTFDPWDEEHKSGRLTIGIKEVKAAEVLEDIQYLIQRYGFEITRYFLVHFEEGLQEPIDILNFNLVPIGHGKIDFESLQVRKFIKAICTLAWVDTDEYSVLVREPYLLSVNATNLIRSIAAWVHILLSKENPYYFSEHRIFKVFLNAQDMLVTLVDLFRIRFNPLQEEERSHGAYKEKRDFFVAQMEKIVDPIERQIFQESLKFIDHVLLTNYYFETKTGLSFRISPDILDNRHYNQKPFGIYFILGRDYRFFQVRWKDVARGGLRIVMPRNHPEYAYALAGLFDEVYGLSYAQQMKNKDIPEGGSKAVMILKLHGNRDRAAKGAVNALLDLLVREEEGAGSQLKDKIVTYYDQEEIIYLGPDENVTKDLIVWITEQAARRKYKYAKAFMSSKPGAGINHKEYGVTSEGLNVYVDHVLKFLGIDPLKTPFTVKMTGGPDGDVAGNELKILHRQYGNNARVVAIADGFGAAYDPEGLNWKELLHLVDSEKSIAEFDASKLSKDKRSFLVRADTNENILKRNNLHFVVPADIFIPAGGRPYTVTEQNADKFLNAHGEPTCKAIVEGANIFFTNEAREKLQQAGIFMIKDSTANKCGVICSSFEVIESLILDEKEFMAIKATYVKQVIDILRDKASQEAELLFRTYALHAGTQNLVAISKEISRGINDLTDVLLKDFSTRGSDFLKDPLCVHIILKHCPPILVEKYKDRISTHLPESYRIAILAAQMASYIIYKEGLNWMETIQDRDIVRAASLYMKYVEETERLIEAIDATKITEKSEIRSILKHSGARVLTMMSLEKPSSHPV